MKGNKKDENEKVSGIKLQDRFYIEELEKELAMAQKELRMTKAFLRQQMTAEESVKVEENA